MPRYYCEYCDISLTHSSVPGRKQHHSGRKHIMNFIEYWAAFQSAVVYCPAFALSIEENQEED